MAILEIGTSIIDNATKFGNMPLAILVHIEELIVVFDPRKAFAEGSGCLQGGASAQQLTAHVHIATTSCLGIYDNEIAFAEEGILLVPETIGGCKLI